MAAVDVESLTITYGKVTAVDDLSFSAEAGEVTCVLGPNGAGKTSTVEALEGLRRPDSGRLSVIGLDPRTDHRALTERIGVMLQEGGVHPAMRVREALRHAAALYREPLAPADLIGRLGLSGLEKRTYRQLSGGEQRRLALALALVGRPQVAFLDEPTAGVDPAGRQVIRQVVADLRGEGVTVVLTTHDLDEAERIADRVVIVVGGRLVAAGTVDELTRASGADANVRFRAPAGLDTASLARHLGDAEVTEVAPGDYLVAAAPTPATVASITGWLAAHDLPLADLRAGRQRLEDVYLQLTAPDRATAVEREHGPAPAEPGAPGEPDVASGSAEPTPPPPAAEPGEPGSAAPPDERPVRPTRPGEPGEPGSAAPPDERPVRPTRPDEPGETGVAPPPDEPGETDPAPASPESASTTTESGGTGAEVQTETAEPAPAPGEPPPGGREAGQGVGGPDEPPADDEAAEPAPPDAPELWPGPLGSMFPDTTDEDNPDGDTRRDR